MAAEAMPDHELNAFNFSRAGLVANDQLRTLRTFDEQFARNLTHTLGAWLRTNATLSPLPATQMLFSQFIEKTSSSCFVLPLRMEPLHVRAAMSMDLKLAPAIIDLLLGGSGRTEGAERELTEIEEAVLGSVLDIVLREWTSAWSPFAVEFMPEQRERDSQGQRLMPLQEKTLVVRFSMSVADVAGELMFCLPSAPVTSTMKAVSHTRDRQRRTPEDCTRMETRLGEAALKAVLHLPSMRLFARDLQYLKPGSLLPLPLQRSAPAELRVGGVAIYRAQPVRAEEHRAARLMHLLDAPGMGGDSMSERVEEAADAMEVQDLPADCAEGDDVLLDIELEARIQFGSREMLLSELLELNAGDVLELDRLVSDPVDLLVGDRIVARGEVVVVGGNFGLQVTEVLAPKPRLESVRCLY